MAATTPRRGLRRGAQPLNRQPRLIVTTGEPAGIGPDLAIAAALRDWSCELVFAGDPALLAARARELKLDIEPSEWRPDADARAASRGNAADGFGQARDPGRGGPARCRQRALRARDARSGDRRLCCRRVHGDGDRTGPEIHHQRRRHRLHGPHRVPGGPLRRAIARDAARRGRLARRARDHAPAAFRGAAPHHSSAARRHARRPRRRAQGLFPSARAAHPGLRAQSARRRRRPPGTRGDRRDRDPPSRPRRSAA